MLPSPEIPVHSQSGLHRLLTHVFVTQMANSPGNLLGEKTEPILLTSTSDKDLVTVLVSLFFILLTRLPPFLITILRTTQSLGISAIQVIASWRPSQEVHASYRRGDADHYRKDIQQILQPGPFSQLAFEEML